MENAHGNEDVVVVDQVAEIQRLRHDNFVHKRIAEKLNAEIQRYQKQGVVPRNVENPEGLPPQIGSITPLIQAYEDRIADLERVLEASTRAGENMEELMKENADLRRQLQERDMNGLVERHESRSVALGSPDGVTKEELAGMYKLAQEQNEILNKQNELLGARVKELMSTQEMSGNQAAHDRRTAHEAALAARSSEECAGQLQQQRDAAQNRLREVLQDFMKQKEDYCQLQLKYEEELRDRRQEKKADGNFRQQYEGRWKQCMIEIDETNKENDRVTKEAKEARMSALANERKCFDLQEKLRISQKQAEATKVESENLLVITESMEKRLKDSNAKLEEAQSELQEQLKETESLVFERDRIQIITQSTQQQMERLQKRMKEDREELTKTLEQSTEGMRLNLTRKVAQLEEEIRLHNHTLTDQKIKNDILEKQKEHEIEQWERRVKLLIQEKEEVESNLESMHQQVLQLEKAKHALELESERMKREAGGQTTTMTQKLRLLEDAHLDTTQQLTTTRNQLLERTRNFEKSETEVAVVRKKYEQLWTEHQAEKNLRAELDGRWQKRSTEELATLTQHFEAELERSKDYEEEAVELLRSQEEMWAQRDEANMRGREGLNDQIERLKRQNMELRLSQLEIAN